MTFFLFYLSPSARLFRKFDCDNSAVWRNVIGTTNLSWFGGFGGDHGFISKQKQ